MWFERINELELELDFRKVAAKAVKWLQCVRLKVRSLPWPFT